MREFDVAKGYEEYDITFPMRSTKASAGYDFYCVEDIEIPPFELGREPTMVPTGLRAIFPTNEFLMLVNRSSNPKKKGLVIPSSMGVVDSDYAGNPDNDGAIFFTFWNMKKEAVHLKAGEKLGQGIFVQYGTTDSDNAKGERTGGFGSTGK